MNSLVSVVMPAFNTVEYLSEAIDSILAQTHKNLELIVVNDGSTDSTDTLMQWYVKQDKRIQYVKTENQGIAKARNTGLKLAKGDYIAVMDSDDVCMQERLQIALKTLEKTNADIFYSAYARADERGNVQDGISPIPPADLSAKELQKDQQIPHVTIVAKKKCFDENPYDDRLTVNDDYDLVWRWYVAKYEFCMSKEPLVLVRYHSTSTSATRDKEVKGHTRRLLRQIESYIKSGGR